MAFNITAIMNVALASGAATKISRDINKALQNKRVTVDLSLANPDSIKRIKADIEGAITSVESFGRQAGLAAKRFGAFSLAAGSMITLVSAIKSSTAEAISFDREMVRLGQVSNDSVASIQAVGNEVTRLSVALGVSSKDLIGAAVTLKQANLSIDDTKIALEALAKAALAPNFENFANTTQGAIAVLNQFKIGAAGLEAALGSVNAVAGEYAVEASDLIEVIRKTGGAFKSAGGDLNELLALFTSVRQTTRESAETISTGLRTIFTRIQRGQTIESLKELGINLRYTSQEATALGNTKLADQFVGPYEAVRRLSEALAGIPTTSGKYSAIVEELGGYRQISKVIPLLQEFSVSQGALNVALGGSSSLAANAAQAQNAYIIKIQKIKEEFNALIRSVTQSSGFQKIFDTFISGASAAIQLADALKFLLPLITAIAAVKLATSFGQFVKGFATGVTASPNPKIFNQNRVAEGGYIKMAKGGVVPGSGSGDKVKALLEPGEVVIPKKYAGGGTISVNEMSSLAIQRKLNDPLIKEEDYKTGKTINKNDNFKYEIVTIKVDGGKESLKGDYKQQGDSFEKEAEKQLGAIRIAKSDDRGSNSPVDLEKNGFPYEIKNVSSPVSDASIVDKLARYRFQKFGDNIFKNSSKGEETIDLGQIGLVYNTAKITGNDAFKDTETITAGQENYRRKTYATQTSEGISNVTLSTQEAKNRLATKKASGGFMIPGTGNTDSVPMDLDEGSFVVRKSSVAKLGAENLSNISRKGYADGGKVPAMLMPGEFVFSPSSAKSIGSANLERMNKHAKFAAGGRVGLAEGGNPNPIGEEAYTVASQTKIKIPNFQSLEQFVKGFPDLTKAQESLEKIILEEVRAFNANLSEEQKLTEATKIASDVMRKYDDLDRAIEAQKQAMTSRGSARPLADIEADQAELAMLEGRKKRLSEKVGLSSTVLPTGDTEFRTKIGTDQKIETGKGKDYEYKVNEKVNISDEIRNRARDRAVKISPSGNGENIASVTKIRLALEEEGKLRNQAIEAIGQQLRITTGITDKQVLLEMATEKFTIAMQQNAKLAKDGQGRLLGLQSLEQDILDSGKDADKSMRGVSIELKQGSTAFGKLKLIFRNMGDAIEGARREIVDEFRKGGGGIAGTFGAIKNSKTLKIAAGVATAAVGIVGQGLASTAGTAEDVSKGSVSESRYVNSTGIGEALNQGATAAIALSMIPVAGPFLAVIGGATAALFGFLGAVKKAQIELMKVQVDKKAKEASEKISELKNFSGIEREQKGQLAFTELRSTVFAIRQTAAVEGLSGAKLEDEVRAKSLEKFGSNLGAISEELSNSIANMVKPDDKRKSVDIYNEFKVTPQGQLAIESLGIASGKSAGEVQKHALALASSAVTAKKLEEAQKNSIAIHEKITLRMSVLTNSVNLASESFKNISESMGNFSEKLEGRSEFKIQQNASRLKIGTDEKLFNKETDRAFLPFGKEGDNLKNQAKELNAFALNLPAAFDAAKLKAGVADVGLTTEEILKKQLGKKQGQNFTSTEQDLIELFKAQIKKEQGDKPDLKGISGEKITKDALGQAISQMEQLLQSNMQSVNQVSQQYISGLRRISDEQKKYIQELDRVAEKTLSVNKAQANIDAAKVRGNPEDFLTREQRIAPFVQKQINVTQGAVNRGAIQAKDIQDPQAIFDAIEKAQKALIISDQKLQEENAKLASANKGDAESARKAALENNNLRDNISTLGEALRNLRDDTVMLAEAESRLTQAEKDRENKLSVTENLLTMDKAGKRSLQRGKDAAEQVAGGANLEDMSTKQKKAFFEYTKLYANIKVPGLGGKTGEQVRQAGLERAAGGQGVPVGKENEAANKAREDILKIEKTREEAAQKYADLLKGNDQANVDALKKVGDNFITELQNMLARENDRNLKGQIAVEDVKKDNLKNIEQDPNYKKYTEIIGKGPNKEIRETRFPTVFRPENLKKISEDKLDLQRTQEFLGYIKKSANLADLGLQKKPDGTRINKKDYGTSNTALLDSAKGSMEDAQIKFEDKIRKLNLQIAGNFGPFNENEITPFLPSPEGGAGIPGGPRSLETTDLLLVAEKLRTANTSIEKLPIAIQNLTTAIQNLEKKLINPVAKANGGFIGRSMGGSIYNNPTKDIAQRDKYPTLLSKGEFVMNEGAARNNRPELEAMNKGHKVGYFDVGGRLTQADIDKSRRETLEERARIANNKSSMTGSSVKKTEDVQGEGIFNLPYTVQKRYRNEKGEAEAQAESKRTGKPIEYVDPIFKNEIEFRSVRTPYSGYPYKDRDGIFNRKDFIDTFGEKNADYSNEAEDIAWKAFTRFESNTNQPKKFPRTFIPVSERVNPISAEDIDLTMGISNQNTPEAEKRRSLLLIKLKDIQNAYPIDKEKELKVKEKYNLTDLKMPEGFKFEGYEKHLDAIRPNRTTGKKGRPDEDITDVNDVKYTIADIRFEFERAVSDLAYVNAESRKLSKNESIAEDVVGRLTYSKDTWKDISNPAASLKQITEDASKFDYEDEFFHELKRVTPRYPFSYGNEIDPSVSNDIKTKGVGLRDAWLEIGGSYGPVKNPMLGKFEAMSIENQIKLRQEQEDENDRNKKRRFITLPQQNLLEENFQNREAEGRLYNPRDKEFKSPIGGEDLTLPQDSANNLSRSLNANEFAHKSGFGGLKFRGMQNQQESDILIDLIKQAREQKKQALAQNIENIKKKVNAQIEAESSLTKGIPLKGIDAKLAKTNENLYARIKNPRLSDDKLPFPVQGFRGEFTPEAEAAPVTRPTIAMQEAQAIENDKTKKQTALNRKNRIDEAGRLKEDLFSEAIRHTNPKDLEGKELDYENVKAFGGKENDIKKMMAFKKSQIQSGDTDPIAQRLHTQIAKTIASYKEPKTDFNDPKVYSPFLRTVNISKLSDVKKLSSVSLKAYADENIPVLNPAIMALQEYYDSVDQRRFGFDQTEDFARTIQNKNIELAAKMDREAAMLLARKIRGEVKQEFPEVSTEPAKDMDRLMKLYKTYNEAVGIKWQGADSSQIHAGDPPRKRLIDESMGKHDYQSKNKDYHNIYDQIDIIANDMVNIGEHYNSPSYSTTYYEKIKRDQAVLESFIKDKIQKAPQGSRNIAIQDFLESQKKEKAAKTEEEVKNIAVNNNGKIKNQSGQVINVPNNPVEAAKVIAEEQAKPVVAAPVEQAKPPVIPIPAEEAKPVALNFDPDTVIWPTKTGAFSGKKYLGDTPEGYNATSWWDISQRDIGMDFFGQYGNGTVTDKNGVENPGLMAAGKEKQVEDLKSIHQQIYNYQSKVSALADKSIKDAAKRVNAEEPDLNSAFEYVDTRTAFRKMVSNKIGYDIKLPDGWSRSGFPLGGKEALSIVPPKEFTHKPVRKQGNGGMGDFEWIPINASSGGPVAYRSVGGSIDTMLTPKEKVFSPRKVAQIESRSPGLLSHINSGGKVKHLGLGGQASFTVPNHAPNPKGIPSANTDTVYARLETGSFVVNAKSSIENASLLQHLASGGSVGYYADGGEIDFSKIQKLKTAMPNPNDMQKVQKALKKRKYQDPNEMQKLKTALPEMMTKKLSTVTDFQKRTETFSPEILKMFEAPEELQKVKSVAPKNYADGGAVGYYAAGDRVIDIANKLDTIKRKGQKKLGQRGEEFEKSAKGKIFSPNEIPKLLKDNKEIDKTYLTGMKHFEKGFNNTLDSDIAKEFTDKLKNKKIKGFSGPNEDFNNANYFGEIGKIFNQQDTFLRNQDVTNIQESLDQLNKDRGALGSSINGQVIRQKNKQQINDPLKQIKNPKATIKPMLNAGDFMKEYGTKDEDGGPVHTAITARAEYFNPNIKEKDYLDLRFKPKEGEKQELIEHTIADMIGRPRRFEQGGHVNGASDGDTIPAFLSAGEFVMPRHAVNRIGLGNLEKMRKPQRFYDGGAVGSPRESVFGKMNNVANSQSANSIDVDSLNNAAREFNKAAKSFETSMAKMEKSVNKLEGTMDKLSKVNIPDTITGTIKVDNKIDLDITSSNFAMDMTTAVGKAVSDITGRLKDATDGKIDIA